MRVIAHRGNNKEALENSRQAFEKAIQSGAQRIELDVQLSRDGHPVINHDNSLFHTTGKHLFCSELDRQDLKSIRLHNGESLPFLDEIVEQFLPRIELNIEIKGNNPELAAATSNVLKGNAYRNKIIISCFNPEPLLYMRDHDPDLERACLVGDDHVPWPFFSHLSILTFMQMVSATTLHPRMDMIGENLMDQAKSRGWKVYTWSPMVGEDIGREGWWTMLMSHEIDGHCTNFPREMVQWLQEVKEHQELVQRLTDHG